VAQLIEFLLEALQYVLPHDTKYRSETPEEIRSFTVFPLWTGARSTGNDYFNTTASYPVRARAGGY